MAHNRTTFQWTSTLALLEPVGISAFFADYWEQKPLHIARNLQDNPFADLISVSTIETILSTHTLYHPNVQLSHAGHAIPVEDYTDSNGKIVNTRLVERYRQGSTIVLSYAHQLQHQLMQLCRAVQSAFLMNCQTNVYLSPAGNQGFNPHFDTHDVFILQVSGKKTFHFYSGGANFPTHNDRFDRHKHKVGSKTESIALSAGDTLYIPRGFVHDAVADSAAPSLHITLGVYPALMYDLVQELVQMALESNAELRRALPQPMWLNSDSVDPTIECLKQTLTDHFNHDTLREALSRLRDGLAMDVTASCLDLQHHNRAKPAQLTDSFQVDAKQVLHQERSGARLTLRLFGTVLEFSDPFAAAVEWLLDRKSAPVEAIPGLDASQRAALIDQLSQFGVLRWNDDKPVSSLADN